jgi:hypothetical protein
MKKMPYVLCHLALIVGYNFCLIASMIGPISRNPNLPQTGFIGDLFSAPDVINLFYFYFSFACYASVIVIYLLVGILVKCRVGKKF